MTQLVLPDINYWQPDDKTGWKHTSNFSNIFVGPGFKAKVQFNSEGFRDKEHRIDKEKDVLRIAVMGDSFVEGLQVNRGNLFTTILENDLNETRKTEVMNFGVSSFGTTNEYWTYKTYVKKYKPDYIVIAFYINDFIDNSELLDNRVLRINLMKHRPYFYLDKNDNLVENKFIPYSDKRNLMSNMLRKIKLLSLLRNAFYKLRSKDSKEILFDEGKLYAMDYTLEIDESVNLTRKILEKFLLTIIRDGSKPIVCLFDPAYLIDDSHKNKLIKNGINFEKFVVNKPFNIIKELCRKLGVIVVDARPFFRKEYKKNNILFLKDGHWNENGHRVIAKCLEEIFYEPEFLGQIDSRDCQ